MGDQTTEKVKVKIATEDILDVVISQLLAQSVPKEDISISGYSDLINKKYGISLISPEIIPISENEPVPIKESTFKSTEQSPRSFFSDDCTWTVCLCYLIPQVLGIYIGYHSALIDVYFDTSIGTLVGFVLGLALSIQVYVSHFCKDLPNTVKGDYILWVVTHSSGQLAQLIELFKSHNIEQIEI